MGTKAGVGLSHHRNTRIAAKEAVQRALDTVDVEVPDFVFLFATVGYDQSVLLAAVREATGRAPLVGCSGEGIIAEGETDESPFSVAVMVISSDELRFNHGVVRGMLKDSRAVGGVVGKSIQPSIKDDTLALFVFPDGVTVNFDQFLAGMESELQLERTLHLLGGTSGDDLRWEQTYQYCDDELVTDAVSYALCSGQARIVWGVNHGCTPLGTDLSITRSEGNVIHEIDGKPVLELIREYIDTEREVDWGKMLSTLPLGLRTPDEMKGYDEYLIRVMTGIDLDSGSIRIAVEVDEGTPVRIMRRDAEKMEFGVGKLAEELREITAGEQPKFVLHFDCAGRGKLLLREQLKTRFLQCLQAGLGSEVPWIGFYTFGEIAPVAGRNCFHNWTAVVAAIY